MRDHEQSFVQAIQVAWIVGPIVILAIALRVRYLRGHGVRTTGTALATRREARTRSRANGSGWETYWVDLTLVGYTDRDGRRYQREIEGRWRQGASVALVYPARRPNRAEHASAASYFRVLLAIVAFAVVLVALDYMRGEVAQDVDNFCAGLDAASREFHQCP